jgi:hypothetical protein
LANGAGELIDVSHESLIRQWDKLKGWVDKEAEKVQKFRDLAGSAYRWQDHKRSSSILKRGADLNVWRQWWKSQNPTAEWAKRYNLDRAGEPAALEPVGLSNEYLRKSRQRVVRKWVGVVAVLVAVACLVPGYFFIKIKIEKTILETDRFETAAARGYDLIKSEDPNLALLLALERLHPKKADGNPIVALAYKLLQKLLNLKEVDDSAIERLAYKALQTPRPKAVLFAPAVLPTATFSPDGQLLLISKGNAFQVWKATELELVVQELRPQGVMQDGAPYGALTVDGLSAQPMTSAPRCSRRVRSLRCGNTSNNA